jgi:hypothetical protein
MDRAHPFHLSGHRRRREGGSVLVIMLVTILFAAFALVAFIEKAGNDLIVEQHAAEARRLRMEAYSALEVTLAVLEDFRQVDNGLHSPAEGWNDPLTFAGYTPTEGRTVDIAFEDESGKISLPRTDGPTLSRLFQSWDISQADADTLADALLGWMQRNHVYTSAIVPDYDLGDLPFVTPGRSLRSYSELAAIDKVRDIFYDADGRPTDLWYRFVDSVSLLNFARPNINGAKPGALLALGQFQPTQQQTLNDYLAGTGVYETQGPGLPFQTAADSQRIAGPGGNAGAFTTTISALRIRVTVHDGSSVFQLAAVICPPNGATTVQTTATATRTDTSANTAANSTQQRAQPNATQANAATATRSGQSAQRKLNYPFTLLEIRENDDIPPPPPPPPPPSA